MVWFGSTLPLASTLIQGLGGQWASRGGHSAGQWPRAWLSPSRDAVDGVQPPQEQLDSRSVTVQPLKATMDGVHCSFMLAAVWLLGLQMDLHICCCAGVMDCAVTGELSAWGRAGRGWFSSHSCVFGLGWLGLCELLAFSFVQRKQNTFAHPALQHHLHLPAFFSLVAILGICFCLDLFYLHLPIVAKTWPRKSGAFPMLFHSRYRVAEQCQQLQRAPSRGLAKGLTESTILG